MRRAVLAAHVLLTMLRLLPLLLLMEMVMMLLCAGVHSSADGCDVADVYGDATRTSQTTKHARRTWRTHSITITR